MSSKIKWGGLFAAIIAIGAFLGTASGDLKTILGFAATQSQTEIEHERLEIFARKSTVLYAGYDEVNTELGIVYFIESHPCVDYEVKYVIHNVVIDSSVRDSSVCEDLPEVKTGTHTVRKLVVDPGLIRPHFYTINGELIESDTVTVLIQWKFKFSDGSFGYHTMTAAIPLMEN